MPGPVLEFGVGTGRIALPLSQRGVRVHGIELSPAMVERLTSQEEQVEAFQNAARHLRQGGHFLIENYVPELLRLSPGKTRHVFAATPDHLGFEEYDLAHQIAVSHHYWVIGGQLHQFSSPHRYVWPAELDLMARMARLTLRHVLFPMVLADLVPRPRRVDEVRSR